MADLDDPITYLFVPADRPERFAKALAFCADRVIIDLEDAVTSKNKTVGRNAVKSAGLNWSRIILRINDVTSSEFERDVSVLRRLPVRTIMVPKADGQTCLQQVVDAFDNARTLIPQIETVCLSSRCQKSCQHRMWTGLRLGILISRWTSAAARTMRAWPMSGHRSCFSRVLPASRSRSIA